MIKGLYSDEKNCEGANPETVEKIPCAYRIMEYLAPVIKDFPLEADVGGDIKMHVYPLALQQARDWFRKVGSDYSILQDTF